MAEDQPPIDRQRMRQLAEAMEKAAYEDLDIRDVAAALLDEFSDILIVPTADVVPIRPAAPCRCGCGETVPAGRDWPNGDGHDTRALHQRIARIGNTAQFCDWMDQIIAPEPETPA